MELLKIPHEQLKQEFQDILFNTKQAVAVDLKMDSLSMSTSNYKALRGILSKEDVQTLRHVAEMLRSTDHFQDCVEIYITSRKDSMDMIYGQVQKKMNVESVRVFAYWEGLNERLQWWVAIARTCIENIFVEEKCVYEQIFGGLSIAAEDAPDQGYVHIIGDAAAKLLEFPNSLMSSSRRLPQKLEILLPVYEEYII